MKPYVLGIDIGGTNTVFGIVDARGVVIASSSIKTKKHNNVVDYLDELHQEAQKLIEANDAVDKSTVSASELQTPTISQDRLKPPSTSRGLPRCPWHIW